MHGNLYSHYKKKQTKINKSNTVYRCLEQFETLKSDVIKN